MNVYLERREEVRVARHQILRRRVGGIAHELVRSLRPRQLDQFLQRGPHALRPHPAHERFLDLVADENGRNDLLPPKKGRTIRHATSNVLPRRRVAQKIDMLGPWNAAQKPQAMLHRLIKRRLIRQFVKPHTIEAERDDVREIRVHLPR